MIAHSDPCLGMRFTFEGSTFEICHVDQDLIRFASCAGGKQHFMKATDWRIKEDTARLAITYVPLRVTPSYIPIGLATESEAAAHKRWHHYIRGLLQTYGWNWPSKKVVLHKVSTLATQISDPHPPSYVTLTRWRRAALNEGLTDQRGIPRYIDRGRKSPYSKVELSWIKREALIEIKKNMRISVHALRDALVGMRLHHVDNLFTTVAFPSERTLCRILRTIDEYQKVRARHGKKSADRRFRPAGKSFEAERFLELVFGDGQLMDVLIVPSNDSGDIDLTVLHIKEASYRPYFTKFMDCRCRYNFPGCISSIPFCTSTALIALKCMVTVDGDHPRGKAEKIVVDNGADYVSDGLKRAISKLQLTLEYAEGDYPDAKAILERYFRELNRFIHSLPGTTFSNPKDRGDYESERLAILTLPQLTKAIAEYDAILNDELHGTTGRAPRQLALEYIAALPPTVVLPQEADHIFRVPHILTIVKGRIKYKDLKWYSAGLASYEQSERALGRKPQVVALINEFNVYDLLVELNDPARSVVMAVNTRPRLTRGLSLWEWNLIRERTAEASKRDLQQVSEEELTMRRYEVTQWLREQAENNRRAVRGIQRRVESRARAAAESDETLDPTPTFGQLDHMPESAALSPMVKENPADPTPVPEGGSKVPRNIAPPMHERPSRDHKAPDATPLTPSNAMSIRTALDDFLSLDDEVASSQAVGCGHLDLSHL